MNCFYTRRSLLRAGAAAAAAWIASPLRAQAQAPRVTITEPAARLRAAPSLTSSLGATVRKGEFRAVLARSANGRWLQLAGSDGAAAGWLFADLAAFVGGRLEDAPVIAATPPPAGTATRAGRPAAKATPAPAASFPFPKWIPRITAAQRAIYAAAPKFGKDLGMFTVVGDCNSQPPVYLRRVANGEFDGSRVDARMQAVLTKFEASFGRVSLAAKGGFGTANMNDPTWADGALCGVDVGPFECEIWISRASVVFIELGTGDQYAWQSFEEHYRPLVQIALRKGVLPVLVTKADDLESHEGAPAGHINSIVRKLAAEYDVPLLDFYAATRDLPNFGLIDEGDKDFHLDGAGMQRHIEATLLTLAALVAEQ
jgi:hypothetical protein